MAKLLPDMAHSSCGALKETLTNHRNVLFSDRQRRQNKNEHKILDIKVMAALFMAQLRLVMTLAMRFNFQQNVRVVLAANEVNIELYHH